MTCKDGDVVFPIVVLIIARHILLNPDPSAETAALGAQFITILDARVIKIERRLGIMYYELQLVS